MNVTLSTTTVEEKNPHPDCESVTRDLLPKENRGAKSPPPCPDCKGKGFQLLPEGRKQFRSYLGLAICRCIESKCICTKKPPYMYMDETNSQLLPCTCRLVRISLSRIKALYARSNIPPKFRFRRIKEFKTSQSKNETSKSLARALDNAQRFLKELKEKTDSIRGWYFYGNSGTGKTLLSCLILNECILRFQNQVRYTKITRGFFNRMRASFNLESPFYGKGEDMFDEISNTEILVIDDFGVQKDSDWEQRTLYDLIDYRYEYDKITIITSNIPPEELKPLFGGRIYSRLREMTRKQDLIDEDYREKFWPAN